MQRVLRLLLVWFLVLAVPVKGMAAVAMLACGPGHHDAAVLQVHAGHQGHQGHRGHDSVDHAAHAGHAAHDHAQHGTMADVDEVSSTTDRVDASDPLPLTHKCSACATCGAGAALPAEPPRFVLPEMGPAAFTPLPLSVVRFVTDGPDRPPRTFLA